MNVAVSVALFVFTTFTDAFKGCMRVLGLGPYSFGASLGYYSYSESPFSREFYALRLWALTDSI